MTFLCVAAPLIRNVFGGGGAAGLASPLEEIPLTGRRPAESDLFQVGLQHCHLPGCENGPHVAIRTHQQPITDRWIVGIEKVARHIEQVSLRTESMDMQARAWLHRTTLDLIAEQCPVPAAEQLEQSARLTGGPTDRGIRGSVTGDHATDSDGLSLRQRGIGITDIKLLHFPATTHLASRLGSKKPCCQPKHRRRPRPSG